MEKQRARSDFNEFAINITTRPINAARDGFLKYFEGESILAKISKNGFNNIDKTYYSSW